jgi:hypothetical protein
MGVGFGLSCEKEMHRLRMFEDMELRRICIHKGEEINVGRR